MSNLTKRRATKSRRDGFHRPSRWLSVENVAERIGKTPEAVHAMAESGGFPRWCVVYLDTNDRVWQESEVEDWLEGIPVPPRPVSVQPSGPVVPPRDPFADLATPPKPKPYVPICGVYFLYQVGELVYVGCSRHVEVRVARHHRDRVIQFDSYSVLPVCEDALEREEVRYILRFKPRFNVRSKR